MHPIKEARQKGETKLRNLKILLSIALELAYEIGIRIALAIGVLGVFSLPIAVTAEAMDMIVYAVAVSAGMIAISIIIGAAAFLCGEAAERIDDDDDDI